jgi:hypothetical protein
MENKNITKLSGVVAVLIAGVLFSLFYILLLGDDIKELESELLEKEVSLNILKLSNEDLNTKLSNTEFSLDILNLSNQELKESEELYITYYNTNGLYNKFYGDLVLLNYYRGSLNEQTESWDLGDTIYVEYYAETLLEFETQLDVLKDSFNILPLNTTAGNLWVNLNEEYEFEYTMKTLDSDLVMYNRAYTEMLELN